MKKFPALFELSKTNFTLKVDPRFPLIEIKKRLSREGLSWGYHSTRSIQTLEDTLKLRPANLYYFKHGSLMDCLSGMTWESPSGQLARLPLTPRHAAGPDFLRWQIGNSYPTGRIIDVTLRLCIQPESVRVFELTVPAEENAQKILREMVGHFAPPLTFCPLPKLVPVKKIPKTETAATKKNQRFIVVLSGIESRVSIEEELFRSAAAQFEGLLEKQNVKSATTLLNEFVYSSAVGAAFEKIAKEWLWNPRESWHNDAIAKLFIDDKTHV